MHAGRGFGLLPKDEHGRAGAWEFLHRAVGERLKVVFVNRFFFPDISATSQLLTDLAVHLAEGGKQVAVVTSRQLYQDANAQLVPRERVNGVEVVRVWTSTFGRTNLVGRAVDYATFYISAAAALWKLAGPGVTVVAKTDPPLISIVAALVCRFRGARLVNWLQDVFPEVAVAAGARVPSGILAWLRDRSLLRAARNVVLGDRMADKLRRSVAVAPSVSVIPNWTDGRAITPQDRDGNPLRREWGLAEKFVVAYSGNMGRVHEFETILGAAERLKSYADIRFLFVGDGRWRSWIEERARKDALDCVVFKPYQPVERLALSLGVGDVHLVSLLPQMEGLIVPSKFYGIAAAGRPTVFIGDPEGEIPRILAEHDIGITVRPGDVGGLAEALLDLKANPERARAMGAKARLVFEARYDKPIAMAKWEAVLRDVAGS